MEKFLLIYHSTKEAMDQMHDMTPEQKEAMMDAWMGWKERHGDAVVDFGAPVAGQTVVKPSGSSAEADDVTGYSLIEAADLDAAKAMLADHPITAGGDDNHWISLYPTVKM